jgi:hypothetical protein
LRRRAARSYDSLVCCAKALWWLCVSTAVCPAAITKKPRRKPPQPAIRDIRGAAVGCLASAQVARKGLVDAPNGTAGSTASTICSPSAASEKTTSKKSTKISPRRSRPRGGDPLPRAIPRSPRNVLVAHEQRRAAKIAERRDESSEPPLRYLKANRGTTPSYPGGGVAEVVVVCTARGSGALAAKLRCVGGPGRRCGCHSLRGRRLFWDGW